MPQRARRVGYEQVPDLNMVVTAWSSEGIFSAIDGDDPPIPRAPEVPFEQVCIVPLLGDDVLQLRCSVCVRKNTKTNGVDAVSEILKQVGGAPTRDLWVP